MAYLDPTVFMMDAGMAMISSEDTFGGVLGQVKAELRTFGKLYHVSDYSGGKFADTISEEDIPSTAGECDLFIDDSSKLRRRYYAVKIENAGDNRWAVIVRQGDKNGPLRSFLTLAISAIGLIMLIMTPGILNKIAGTALILLGLFIFCIPSTSSHKTAKEIISTLERI